MMAFRFIDRDWQAEFEKSSTAAKQRALIITPFLQKPVVEKLLGDKPKEVKVITRFNLDELLLGVSDVKALQYLLDIGAEVKGIRHLHAKVYIFGNSTAIVTSANLTQAALFRNTEFGMQSSDAKYIQDANEYFDLLWKQAGATLTPRLLKKWTQELINAAQKNGGIVSKRKLGDKGTEIGLKEASSTDIPEAIRDLLPEQYFIKFFGTSSDRVTRSSTVYDAVKGSHCHLFLSYPRGKKPRQVRNGDVMFCGLLTKEPNDIMIYGRVRGIKYDESRDNVTRAELRKSEHEWREYWPHYIRVYNAEFMKGSLDRGISLYELMKELGHNTFLSTYENALRGSGNTNPRLAYMQRADVRLTPQAAQKLNELLNDAFAQYGQLTSEELEKLD